MSITPILALLPESQYTWTLTHQLQPYIAQIPTEITEATVGSELVHTYAPKVIPANEVAITCCAAKDGNVWVLYDDEDIENRSILRKFDPRTGVQIGSDIHPKASSNVIGDFVRVGDLGAYKSLMEADCDHILSVDRATREVLLVKVGSQDDSLTPGVGDRAFPLSTLTSDGVSTATGTRVEHGVPLGVTLVTIEGAEQDEFNGTFGCTVVDENTFTYTVSSPTVATATGFITATFPADADDEIGLVTKRFGLSVTPLDAAINSAGTRLLYLEDACAKLYDLENDEFSRIVVANIPCFGTGGGGGVGGGNVAAPCSSTTGPPTGPPWFLALLTAHGATNCWTAAVMLDMEGDLNALGYYYQRHSPPNCGIRGRLYYDPGGSVMAGCGFLEATHFGRYADTTRADGGWQFVANF